MDMVQSLAYGNKNENLIVFIKNIYLRRLERRISLPHSNCEIFSVPFDCFKP